jgi:aryl-alcohol dehydrogenase-like predicted oxidoreductase
MRRQLEREVLPVCEREGLGQLVFSPLAQGVLTGKYSGGARPAGSRATDPKNGQWMTAFLEETELTRVDRLRPIASEAGLSLSQLALAWCLRQPDVASVIVGATRREQLEENCKASGVRLSQEVLDQIDGIFPGPRLHVV